MQPRILVLYYSQSGQLRHILDSITSTMQGAAVLDFAEIEPATPFPFPWSSDAFFDVMPETVSHIPISLNPLPPAIKNTHYDLIMLGYQSWFLNPSLPITSFLQGEDAAWLSGKRIITVIGCRNMWLHGQEIVKRYLEQLGARLIGNIVLTDRNPNLLSVITIVRWSFTGKKEATVLLPEAGVSQKDIAAASRFGAVILKHLSEEHSEGLQTFLLKEQAIQLNPGLILLEQRGIKNFRFWASYVREKGGPGAPERKARLLLFKRLLATGIFVLSPLSALTAILQKQLKRRSLQRDVAYFLNVHYEAGRL